MQTRVKDREAERETEAEMEGGRWGWGGGGGGRGRERVHAQAFSPGLHVLESCVPQSLCQSLGSVLSTE